MELGSGKIWKIEVRENKERIGDWSNSKERARLMKEEKKHSRFLK